MGDAGGAGVLQPLREGILRAPVVLAIEEKALAVKRVAATLGADGGASAGGAHALGFDVAGGGGHFADGRFADAEAAPASPSLAHGVLRSCGLSFVGGLRAGCRTGGDAEGQARAGAIDRYLGGLLRATEGRL